MGSRVNMDMIDYIARQAANVICIEGESPIIASKNLSVILSDTLMFRSKLPTLTKGTTPCTRHRVFLATLVVAAKYLNDSTLKNKHWAQYALFFTIEEITLMETQLLGFLDYDLRFDEEEACHMFAPFMATPAQRASTRALAVDRVVKAGRARVQAQQIPDSSVEAIPPHLPSQSSSTSSGLASTVRTLAKRISNTHISSSRSQSTTSTASSPMYTSLSTTSTLSSSSSDVGSLIEDSGSSSGSSSGWNTSDSESDLEEYAEPEVYSNSSMSLYPRDEQVPERLIKSSSIVRSMPSYAQKSQQLRSRKPSDASSIFSISVAGTDHVKDSGISSSATMPIISRGTSGNFLARIKPRIKYTPKS
ncbi:hypothetical protein LENED_010814 [Lentinula edodes]|uniref:Cyclin N-terminal domain-containing protein n=1 Tax=Lentinula edodes TaxID=5353 RepID=A0A1Q3ENE8_LENED|nr:hypothetical protein LENED_010814 [Lentinula edodes]